MQQNKKYFRRGDLAAKQAEEYKKKQEVNSSSLQFQTINSHHCLPYIFSHVALRIWLFNKKISVLKNSHLVICFCLFFDLTTMTQEKLKGKEVCLLSD